MFGMFGSGGGHLVSGSTPPVVSGAVVALVGSVDDEPLVGSVVVEPLVGSVDDEPLVGSVDDTVVVGLSVVEALVGSVVEPADSVALLVCGVVSLVVVLFVSSPHPAWPSARAKMVMRDVMVRIVRVTPEEIGVG